ncbi:adhesion G-protein coupled receptor D2, partial [Protobothrops mucrosquamatus]|uniref:adhesion G-protein coupled receptor D2 n=1 Tax=Protobothrops mucrosquamatus TaxID=103944 RepID=UPI000775C1BA
MQGKGTIIPSRTGLSDSPMQGKRTIIPSQSWECHTSSCRGKGTIIPSRTGLSDSPIQGKGTIIPSRTGLSDSPMQGKGTIIPSQSWECHTSSCRVVLPWRKTLAFTIPAENHVTKGSSPFPLVFETPTVVYEYVSDLLDWWHANVYCQQRFAQLPSESWEDDLSYLGQNFSRRLQSAIWIDEEELFQRKPKQRRVHSPSILIFKNKTDTKFVKVLADFPVMAAVSACAHVQWDPTATDVSTVFSYAVPAFTNEFQLRGIVDKDQFVKFAIILHGHHSPYLPVFRTDKRWHHFCVTWQQPNGSWVIYADGKQKASSAGLAPSRALDGHGTFIIGQDQDSLGGAFKEKESFSGNLTDLQVWARVLSQEQVEKVRSCVSIREGLIFDWRSDLLEVEISVQEATVQLICPDLYFQLKKTQSEPVPPFIARVNAQANTTVIPENVFQADVRAVTISAAANRLGVVEKILSEAQPPPLDASSLLGVFQLLKEVSEVEVVEPGQLATLEELGQHYVEITGRLLEEDNTDHWSETKLIIGGPMKVVENVDKMASSLHQLLSPNRGKVTFHSKNIGIEVRRAELGPERAGSGGSLMPTHRWDQLDAIEIPAEEVERLRVRGKVMDDGRHLSTQVASSIISSSLVSNYEEISTSVQYRLRHRVQALPDQLVEPVCAFWNFSRSPEGVGGWSTRGCSVSSSQEDLTTCACNHTTNFAVLLQVYEVQRSLEEESTLKTLTFVGCGVSFCALIVTFVLFLAVGVPKSERTTVHKNLIFALAAAEALLMFSELAKINQGVCFAVTAFLHLFFMAAFAWMLVEGLLLWSKVVAVNMSEDRRMRFYYVTGWGLPVLIVGVTLATSFNKYVADNHCWLNVQTEVIWAFVGPVLFVLTVNTFVLFRVVMVTVSSARRRSRMLTPNSSLEKQIGVQIWATTKPILVLLPVLGLTWVCGILVHLSITWAYIFIMLNSLQGLYIFLVYALYNSEVRNAIQRMREKKKALSFTNCSHPVNYLSSPRNTSWEMARFNPTTPESTSCSTEKDTTSKSKGNFSAKIPRTVSSIMSPEKPWVSSKETCLDLDPDLHKVMEVHLPSQHLDPDLHKVMEAHLLSQHLDPDLHKVMRPTCLRSIWIQTCTTLWRPTCLRSIWIQTCTKFMEAHLPSIWIQTCTKFMEAHLPWQHLDPDLHDIMEAHLPLQHLDPDLHKVMEAHLPSYHLDPDLNKDMEVHLPSQHLDPKPAE